MCIRDRLSCVCSGFLIQRHGVVLGIGSDVRGYSVWFGMTSEAGRVLGVVFGDVRGREGRPAWFWAWGAVYTKTTGSTYVYLENWNLYYAYG